MKMWTRLASAWRNLFRSTTVERDLDREMNGYLDLLTDEKIARGDSPASARRAALLEMGGVEPVKERVRDVRAGQLVETALRDLRYGARLLARTPGFSLAAILALTLGIGATTVIFSLVYGVLFRPLPYPDDDRLAMVAMHFTPQNAERGPMSIADYLDWRAANRSFEDAVVYQFDRFPLIAGDEPAEITGATVSAGFFSALGVPPLAGRVFGAHEHEPSSDALIVIGEDLWRRRFGGRADAIGQVVSIGSTPHTIVGVMPASFHFPQRDSEMWANMRPRPPSRRGPFFLAGVGRLKPGVTLAQAQAETNTIGRAIEQANPRNYTNLTMPVVPMRDVLIDNAGLVLFVISAAVGSVLLIALANVANLLLARAATRRREIALRLSLGASRARIIRQLLTESVLLSGIGGLAGIALAHGGLVLLKASDATPFHRINEVVIDGRILAFTCVISILSGVLFGLAPAWQSAQETPNVALKDGARGQTSGRTRRGHAVLIVAEIALALILLVGAGLLLRSFVLLQRANTGVRAPVQDVVTLGLTPPARKFRNAQTNELDRPRVTAYYTELVDRLKRMPRVQAVSVSDTLPPNLMSWADSFALEGQTFEQAQANPTVPLPIVLGDYFRTLGIPVIKGRAFTERDFHADAPSVVLLSASLARLCFPGRDPIGQRFKVSGWSPNNDDYSEVVGIAADVPYDGLQNSANAQAYYLPLQPANVMGTRMAVIVRGDDARTFTEAVRRELRAFDPEMVVSQPQSLDQLLSASVSGQRFRTVLLTLFAGVAILLAAIGIYGVIAYAVAQRTHEMGLRLALGAARHDVFRLVMGDAAKLTAVGVVIGLAVAFVLTRWLSTLLFGIGARDPLTFAGVSLTLMAVALMAAFVPASRAMRIDPMTALRQD